MLLGCPNCRPSRMCVPCVEKHINRQDVNHPGRMLIAKNAKMKTYPDACPVHGETRFLTDARRLCVECHPDAPIAQTRASNQARAEARRAGQKTYEDHCSVHGYGPHSVSVGKCAQCFTTGGQPILPPTPRTLARRAGRKTYDDTCDLHGHTAFATNTGKCVTCFTFSGLERTWAPKPTAEQILRNHGWSDDEILAALGPPETPA